MPHREDLTLQKLEFYERELNNKQLYSLFPKNARTWLDITISTE